MELLIAHEAPLATTDATGNSPLHIAVSKNQPAIVKLLLAKGAEINHANLSHETPLLVAGRAGHFNLLKLLIENGASVNVQAHDGEIALISASRFGYPELVQLLVRASYEEKALPTEQVRPLLSSSLAKMMGLCSEVFEFQQMCESAVQHLIDTWRLVQEADEADEDDDMQMKFAKIVFRLCRFLLTLDRKSVLSRVLASRITERSIRQLHEEIAFFSQLNLSDSSSLLWSDWSREL